MRKIIVQEFITLDGVMQSPGGSKEDEADGFAFGGWVAPYLGAVNKEAGKFMKRWMESTDILLGRTTFEIFAGYWPGHADFWPGINDVTKYVASTSIDQAKIDKFGWNNSILVNGINEIKKLKESAGGVIKVHGSGKLVQTLFKYDLVDELWLMRFPITLGTGKRLFEEGTIPAAWEMTDSSITSNSIVFTYFKRAGDVKTETIGK